MANKRIINSAPPKPSKRIIGGSNQRSKARLNLQASYSWRYNHAPENLDEAQNANWWRVRAERFIAPLSSSGDILYGRQSVKRELGRQVDRQRIYDINAEVDKIAQREWMTHIASLAWENIKGDFSDSVRETYIQISQGRKSDEIAAALGISPGSVYVYKERVQKALRKEVRRLDKELG